MTLSLSRAVFSAQIIQEWTTVLQSKLSNASFLRTFYINKVVFENYWLLKVKVGIHRAGKGFGSKFFRLAPCHVSLSAMYSPAPQMFGRGLLACLLAACWEEWKRSKIAASVVSVHLAFEEERASRKI